MTAFVYEGNDGCRLHAVTLGSGPAMILLHGGGPDHRSLLPLARRLADRRTLVLPDVRGYGRSVCANPDRHTWAQYSQDVTSLLDHLGLDRAVVGGTGLGGTIALRAAATNPERIGAALVISAEDIEDDETKQDEAAMFDRFAARVTSDGIEAAWSDLLPSLAPLIGNLVRDAIPRSDPASIVAACAIGRDRAFRSVEELRSIHVPALIVPGADARHPTGLGQEMARNLPHGQLAPAALSESLRTAEDLGQAMAPVIEDFLDAQARLA